MMQLHPTTNHHHHPPQYPYHLEVPPWTPSSSPNSPHDLDLHSPSSLFALSRFLPSNNPYGDDPSDDASSDDFRMYEFKVRRCTRGRSHDWTECPYAHPGEKARRRDPRKYLYSGAACPDFRKGSCKKGDACDLAHGVFECWLHPARYRTQPCKDGINCRRRVCFFAHTPEQLRVVPSGNQNSPRLVVDSYDGSPARHHHNHHLQPSLEAFFPKSLLTSSSPTSTLMSPISPPSVSPPLSPSQPMIRRSPIQCGSNMDDVLNSFRQLRIGSWASPRGSPAVGIGFSSLPCSSRSVGCSTGLFDLWDEPVERVESGRDLRAKIAEKLSKENCVKRADDGSPDVAWVSDLVN